MMVMVAMPTISFAKLGDPADTVIIQNGGCDPNGGYCTYRIPNSIDSVAAVLRRLHDLEYSVSLLQKDNEQLKAQIDFSNKNIIIALTTILAKLK